MACISGSTQGFCISVFRFCSSATPPASASTSKIGKTKLVIACPCVDGVSLPDAKCRGLFQVSFCPLKPRPIQQLCLDRRELRCLRRCAPNGVVRQTCRAFTPAQSFSRFLRWPFPPSIRRSHLRSSRRLRAPELRETFFARVASLIFCALCDLLGAA